MEFENWKTNLNEFQGIESLDIILEVINYINGTSVLNLHDIGLIEEND